MRADRTRPSAQGLSRRHRGIAAGALPMAVSLALAMAACSAQDPAQFDSSSPSAAADPSLTPDQQRTDPQSGAGSSPTLYQLDPADVVESYVIDLNADPEGSEPNLPAGSTITVGVHRLEVMGESMLLELYLTPDFPGDPDTKWSVFDMIGTTNPLLTDREQLLQYRTLWQGPRIWDADVVATKAGSGETVRWWAYFPAPAEDVQSLELQVAPTHPVLEIGVQR